MRDIKTGERRARLGRRHFLAPGSQSHLVEEVAGGMVGLHATDPATVYLSARPRLVEPSIKGLEDALYEQRSLIRMIGMRRTMFVVPLDLASVLQASCAVQLIGPQRRRAVQMLEDAGITESGEAWLQRVEEETMTALKRRGSALARELVSDVSDLGAQIKFGEGTKWAGTMSMSTRTLFLLSLAGRIGRGRPRGTWASSQHRWEPIDRWRSDGLAVLATGDARSALVGRWLATFGPGTIDDLKWWTGWPLGEVRKTLAAVGAVEISLDGIPGWVSPHDLDEVPPSDPWVALLPALDSTSMGWAGRDFYLGPHRPALFDNTGNIGPTVWVDGRIVGGWAQTVAGSVAFRLLESVGREANKAIATDAAKLEEWIKGTKVTPRFRTPLEKELT